jgi:hypothetical protein
MTLFLAIVEQQQRRRRAATKAWGTFTLHTWRKLI